MRDQCSYINDAYRVAATMTFRVELNANLDPEQLQAEIEHRASELRNRGGLPDVPAYHDTFHCAVTSPGGATYDITTPWLSREGWAAVENVIEKIEVDVLTAQETVRLLGLRRAREKEA